MRILVINSSLHHKNKIGLEFMLNYLQLEYAYGKVHDIQNHDVIYSPSVPIDSSKYPTKYFIFGPHFSVFPNNKMTQINNVYNNSVYIQPSDWVVQLWENMNTINTKLPIQTLAFPVDINKFSPILLDNKKEEVFIYFKRRHPVELNILTSFLDDKLITYKIFDYVKRYDETDYLNCLRQSKYGIILDAHESQGFALEEALACNVPLLVWNTKIMSQEYGSNYPDIPCTTIPYWDDRCGEYFFKANELKNTFDRFVSKLNTYQPRQYIIDNLSVESCSVKLNNMLNHIRSTTI